MFGTLS
jgi:hypothetical protein